MRRQHASPTLSCGPESSRLQYKRFPFPPAVQPPCHPRMAETKDKPDETQPDTTVPKAVVSRLSLYLRELQHLIRDGHETTSSTQLGRLLGFTDAQVRKDLAYFGHFGYPGVGNLLYIAVSNQDFPMMQALFLVITVAMLVMIFIVDLLYVRLDPRVRQ